MYRTSGAATFPYPIVCRCGSDHRETDNRQCPVFNILTDLNNRIQMFLDYQKVLEFGKEGAMAHCLRTIVLKEYDKMIKEFQKKKAFIEQHPGWRLADDIAGLQRYFDQVADGCAEAKETLGSRPPPSVVPHIASNEEKMVRDAILKVEELYYRCESVINQFLHLAVPFARYREHAGGCLPKVDNAFKETFEAIIGLPGIENATIKDLIEKSYDIWKENRRLLCEFDLYG